MGHTMDAKGDIAARRPHLFLFSPRPHSSHVAVISDYVPYWRHTVAKRNDPVTGNSRRTYKPCAASVSERIDGENVIHYGGGPEPCPLCEMTGKRWSRVSAAILHFGCEIGVLEAESDYEDGMYVDQGLFIWRFGPGVLKKISKLGVIAFETRISIERTGAKGLGMAITPYDGPHLPISPKLSREYREHVKGKLLEEAVQPPSYDAAKKDIDQHFRFN